MPSQMNDREGTRRDFVQFTNKPSLEGHPVTILVFLRHSSSDAPQTNPSSRYARTPMLFTISSFWMALQSLAKIIGAMLKPKGAPWVGTSKYRFKILDNP